MSNLLKTLLLAICLTFYCNSQAQTKTTQDDLVSSNGLSELKLVFEPGLKIGKEEVRKTFQPSFVITSTGTLLVFCQGRLRAGADNDPKVVLMNKSFDLGKTWEGVEVLSSPMNFFAISPYSAFIQGNERISFITCVGLKVTKRYYNNDPELLKVKTGIDLNIVGNDKAAVLCRYYSEDDGMTWNQEVLTGDKTPLYKKYYGFTPVFMNTIGQVHKIPNGEFKDRMIIAAPMYSAADGDTLTDDFRNHMCTGSGIIYSDDRGETWQMDGMITDYLANEASAVSIENGEALLMIRRINKSNRYAAKLNEQTIHPDVEERIATKSYDGGKTWSDPYLINVSDILCHGTLAKVNNRLYFSIPVGLENRSQPKNRWDDDRIRGAIYFSDNDGESWKYKIVEENYYSYSTIGKLSDDYLITFFSRGGHGRFGIGYRIFTDRWLDK